MHNPDPGGAHDVRIVDREPVCVRCGTFGLSLRGVACERYEPVFHVQGDESGKALCGERTRHFARLEGNKSADCARCLAALEAMPPPGAHSFRAWGAAALCFRCGENASDPDLTGPLCPAPHRVYRGNGAHAAADPLDPAGTFLCDPAADPPPSPYPRRAALVRSGRQWFPSVVTCPDCLAAAARLPAYADGIHDLRLFADGVICAVCGTAAASAADAGGCPGDAPDALRRARERGVAVSIPNYAVHGPGAGCRHSLKYGDHWRKRRERGEGRERLRVTCRSCRRIAAVAPRIAAA